MKLVFEDRASWMGEPLDRPCRHTREVPGFTAKPEVVGEGWGETNAIVLRRSDNGRIIAIGTDGGWEVGKWIHDSMRVED